jgi:YidC/Oxa1 family membrane protein insertase
MDNPRIYLWIALAMLVWMNVIQWNRDYGVPTPAASADTAQPATADPAAGVGGEAGSMLPTLPSEDTQATATETTRGDSPAPQRTIRVVTDVLDMDISLLGGSLVRADLLKYPKDKEPNSPPVRLLDTDESRYSVARTGLRAAGGRAEPTHLATLGAAEDEYRLAKGSSELQVPLTWTDGNGLSVTKTYVFKPGSYQIDLVYQVNNATGEDWVAASYVQFARHVYERKRSMFNVESYAYRGPAIYDGAKYRKLDASDEDDTAPTREFSGGWMAELQHHFVTAAVPPPTEEYDYTLGLEAGHSLISYRGPLKTVPSGGSAQYSETLFVGPKLQKQLKAVAPKLELTADYGKLTILSQPLFWLLEKVHSFVGNWGWAIIIVTILLKLLFYKLTETSGRSMAKMRTIAPRIKSIQERYKDDREQLAKQMMEIYKREKINPVAGCLPILVQIPVFLAFYWVLLESVEMRQAPWMLWIQDLSSRDPYFILPIAMGAAMFGQFKLNPAPPDPMQAKIFAFMPVMMTVMMAWFPAGLVLYWLTNTLLSMAQQWNINRVVEREAKRH